MNLRWRTCCRRRRQSLLSRPAQRRDAAGWARSDHVFTEADFARYDEAFDEPGAMHCALHWYRAALRRWPRSAREIPGAVRCPTLLLWGREDLVTPVAIGEKLVRQLPNARLNVYPRCGHFPMLEAVSESTRDLNAFLGGGQ